MNSLKSPPYIIGVGELLWDMLPGGKQLGGAPANFTYHAQALGAQAMAISRVGNDWLGREILEKFQEYGLDVTGISVDAHAPTGTVSVALDANGTPTFTIHENVAWDVLEVDNGILSKAAQADAVCFGTLAQRSARTRESVRTVVKATPVSALRLFDVNLRQNFWSPDIIQDSLQLANVFKLNDEELPIVAQLFGLVGTYEQQLRQLACRFQLKAVALTQGANGSSLLIDGAFVTCPGSAIQVVDTVGAGDSYTAALAMGLLANEKPEKILEQAHRVANFVCTQPGAMPKYSDGCIA